MTRTCTPTHSCTLPYYIHTCPLKHTHTLTHIYTYSHSLPHTHTTPHPNTSYTPLPSPPSTNSQYQVIAVPMHKGTEGTYTPVIPLKHLVSKALTPQLVSKAKVPVPFTVCTLKPSALPTNVTVDFSQNITTAMAFQSDEMYSFTTVAFSYKNGQVSS